MKNYVDIIEYFSFTLNSTDELFDFEQEVDHKRQKNLVLFHLSIY